ncbi:MAG: hypothetical protein RJQ00_06040 [Vicingaceae bacterium]
MSKTALINELKKAIKEEIGECDPLVWGKLCELRATEKGYEKIEEMVIRMVAKEGMPIGSALAHIEQELGHQLK